MRKVFPWWFWLIAALMLLGIFLRELADGGLFRSD